MFKIPIQNSTWEIEAPQIMGILNVTNDSFYASSRVNSVDLALEKARKFIHEGANILDIGGQSTRPGAQFINTNDEIKNVVPIIEALRSHFPNTLISIDTFNSQVADQALMAGANIVNDISCGSFDDKMYKVVAAHNAGYIGMHITGSFETMHEVPKRENIMKDLIEFFEEKIDATCCSSKDIEFFKGNNEYFFSVKMKSGELEINYFYDNKDVLNIDQLLFDIGEKIK